MKKTKLLLASSLFAFILLFTNCAKDRAIPVSTQETLVRSNWSVDYYFNGQNLTANYSNNNFLFSSTGLLAVQKSTETITGTWSGSLDGINEMYDLSFNTSDANIYQLNGHWKLVNKSSTTIEFEKNEIGNPLQVLRIRKN